MSFSRQWARFSQASRFLRSPQFTLTTLPSLGHQFSSFSHKKCSSCAQKLASVSHHQCSYFSRQFSILHRQLSSVRQNFYNQKSSGNREPAIEEMTSSEGRPAAAAAAASSTIMSSLPYHVHTVRVSQPSILTEGRIIEFDISVIDTHPPPAAGCCDYDADGGGGGERATVMGLHGMPGTALDFEPCVQSLRDRGVRFIGPTLPGSELSEVESWKLYHLDFSSAGCTSILLQVMDHLHIDRVDTLMCHSAGAWTGYRMAAETDRVKSLALFNPGGAKPHRTLKPQFAIHFLAWLMRIQSLHFLLMPLMEFIYTLLGFTGVKGGDHLMVTQQVASLQNFDHTKQHVQQIRTKRLPLLCAYTLNDKIVERQVTKDLLFQQMSVPPSCVTSVNADKLLTPVLGSSVDQEARPPWYVDVLQCERGGHVVHKAHSQVIVDRIMTLLNHVNHS